FGKAGGQDFHQAKGRRERGSLFVIGGPERGWKGWNAGAAKNQILNHVVYSRSIGFRLGL
ncbi:MAG: hypothetical protein KGJ02_02935, partial [Verrucomicrobiota bacterium]|nr:hypothetical protein [Verrucomicrobiota bacterium]